MKNSADLGGCYHPPRAAEFFISRKPNSIIAKYIELGQGGHVVDNINNKFFVLSLSLFSFFLFFFCHNKSENALFLTMTMAALMSHGGLFRIIYACGWCGVRARVLYQQKCMVFPPQKIRLMKNVNTEWTNPQLSLLF